MSKRIRSQSVASSDRASLPRDKYIYNANNNWQTMDLQARPNQKFEKSHDFFKQTKISTCSYIKKTGNHF